MHHKKYFISQMHKQSCMDFYAVKCKEARVHLLFTGKFAHSVVHIAQIAPLMFRANVRTRSFSLRQCRTRPKTQTHQERFKNEHGQKWRNNIQLQLQYQEYLISLTYLSTKNPFSDWSILTVAHICKHNKQFLKHDTIYFRLTDQYL